MKNTYIILGIAAVILLLSGCINVKEASKKATKKITDAGNRHISYEEAKRRADAGDGHMASRTGFMLENGTGVKKDPKLALVYYEKAVQTGGMAPSRHIMDLIHKTGDTERVQLFGDCYQRLWDDIWAPYVWSIKRRKYSFRRYEDFEKSYSTGVKICLDYLELLEKSGQDAYSLKQRLISIVRKKPSGSGDNVPRKVTDLLEKLAGIRTKTEQKQAGIELQRFDQNQKLKFPNGKLGKGIKLYKDIYAGTSIEWLRAKSASSNGKIKKVSRPMFEDEFLPEIPELWRGQTFRRNYETSGDGQVSYIFAGTDDQQILIGCCIMLRNVLPRSIIEKYKKEFPGLKIQEKRVPQMRLIVMVNQNVRIQVVLMQPGNFVSIFIADRKYVDVYRNIIQKKAEDSSRKALDF